MWVAPVQVGMYVFVNQLSWIVISSSGYDYSHNVCMCAHVFFHFIFYLGNLCWPLLLKFRVWKMDFVAAILIEFRICRDAYDSVYLNKKHYIIQERIRLCLKSRIIFLRNNFMQYLRNTEVRHNNAKPQTLQEEIFFFFCSEIKKSASQSF